MPSKTKLKNAAIAAKSAALSKQVRQHLAVGRIAVKAWISRKTDPSDRPPTGAPVGAGCQAPQPISNEFLQNLPIQRQIADQPTAGCLIQKAPFHRSQAFALAIRASTATIVLPAQITGLMSISEIRPR